MMISNNTKVLPPILRLRDGGEICHSFALYFSSVGVNSANFELLIILRSDYQFLRGFNFGLETRQYALRHFEFGGSCCVIAILCSD